MRHSRAAGRPYILLTRGTIGTPIGDMLALVSDRGVVMCDFVERSSIADKMKSLSGFLQTYRITDGGHPFLEQLRSELTEYFEGKRKTFRVPLQPIGTPFQMRVWGALSRIPYGAVVTYAQQTRMVSGGGALRAVASADGRNRLLVLLPCHRVVGAGGALVGYSGGIDRKAALLRLERRFL